MKIFESEANMQNWLSNKFANGESLSEMIINYDEYKENACIKTGHMVTDKLNDTYLYCLESFVINEVITENQDISLEPKDRLCSDFLVYAPETQSVIIIELKNIHGPTRQAGTEIGAYAAEVRTYLPFIAEGDVITVIISNEWPTLLLHYAFNEIFWLQKKLICLKPQQTDEGVQLSIVDLNALFRTSIQTSISSQQLGGYQLCLYDDELYKGGDYNRIAAYETQMRIALQAMANRGNSLKSHGFAFLWRHCFHVGLAPYNITIINVAPFQSLVNLFKEKDFRPNDATMQFINVLREHDPEGHGYALEDIKNYGQKFIEDFCSPRTEGFDCWENLKPAIFDQTDALAFVGWGIFGELFFDRLAIELKNGIYDCDSTNPLLAISLLNEIIIEDHARIDYSTFRDDEISDDDELF